MSHYLSTTTATALLVALCACCCWLQVQCQSQSSNERFSNYNNNNNNNYNTFTTTQQQHYQQQQQQVQQQQHQHQQVQQQQQRPIISSTTTGNINAFGHQQSTATATAKPKDQWQKDYVDYFNHRYPDGSYEFRYELTDGTARYERGYYMLFDKVKAIVVVGYYSYRTPKNEYVTVFYNADQNGYRQNLSITPQVHPNLPRSIDVPAFDEAKFKAATQTKQQQQSHANKAGAYQNQI